MSYIRMELKRFSGNLTEKDALTAKIKHKKKNKKWKTKKKLNYWVTIAIFEILDALM